MDLKDILGPSQVGLAHEPQGHSSEGPSQAGPAHTTSRTL